MPVSIKEIHPFLAAVLTGGAVEVGVSSRLGQIDQTDQVIFHGSLMFHVKIELAVHGFKLCS